MDMELVEFRAKRAAYMREWRLRPGNYDRTLANKRASYHRCKDRDPIAFLEQQRRRQAKYRDNPEAREKHRDAGKKRYAAGIRSRRRGLTPADQHEYWLYQRSLCDFCKQPYPDPQTTHGRNRDLAVDHDRDHVGCKSPSLGCRDCVRGQGHRECNVIEGFVKKALQKGLLTGIWGPLADYLANPPIQRWLAERDAAVIAD